MCVLVNIRNDKVYHTAISDVLISTVTQASWLHLEMSKFQGKCKKTTQFLVTGLPAAHTTLSTFTITITITINYHYHYHYC